MGYRHPRKRLKSTDTPNPRLFRGAVQPIAEEVGGKLNEHNIVDGTFGSVRRSEKMLYDFHYASVSANPNIPNVANPAVPTAADPDVWRVPDGGDWAAVGGVTLTYTAGDHVAWAIGWCFYGVVPNGSDNFSIGAQTGSKPRVQFALRINGTVIEETITGTANPDDGAPRNVRPISPVTSTAFAPPTEHQMRTLDYETARPTGSFGWHVRPVRVQCQIAAAQGSTVVELVARRTINVERFVGSTIPSVYVYNRKLISVEMRNGSTTPSVGQAVPQVYPQDGTPLNVASINTDLYTPVVTAMNDLNSDAIQRAGLRQEHIPGTGTSILTLGGTGLTAGSTTARNWPGWGSDGTVSAGQWDIVNNGAGLNCEATVTWNFANNPGFVLILGNVAHKHAEGAGNRPDRYGVYSIATRYTNGTYSMGQSAQCWINNPNIYTEGAPLSNECYTDVPLLEFYDFRSAPPANGQVDSFRVNVAASNTFGVYWDNSSIFAIVFNP